jgi:enoyl-CoA hydratase/carnithine racemase
MSYQKIILEALDHIVLLKLNDPQSLNPMSKEMGLEFQDAMEKISQDPKVRGLVITGSGRAFSAGGNVKLLEERVRTPACRLFENGRKYGLSFLSVRKLRIPTIAAVNGYALGAGACLAIACDIRIASEKAQFGFPFVRIGMHPGLGATYFLPRIVGAAKAYELLTACETIDAAEAKRIGLASYVVPEEELISTALGLVRKISSMPLLTIKMVKESIYAHLETDLETALNREVANQAITFTSEDIKEGIAARQEKRPPQFKEIF